MKLKNVLVALLIAGTFGVSIQAATSFKDVQETAWYYKDVTQLVDRGIVSGYPDGTFKPSANVSNAESLKFILSASGIAPKEVIGEHGWAEGYIRAAIEKNIIDKATFNKNALTTRQEMAEMIVKALGVEFQTTVIKGYFKDTTNQSVETLYDMGLIGGVKGIDGLYYKPTTYITRAEVSVLATRLFNYFEKENTETTIIQSMVATFGITDSLKASEIALVKEPQSVEDFEKVLLYMASSGKLEYEIPYTMTFDNLTNLKVSDTINEASDIVFSKYPEYFSFLTRIAIQQKGSLVNKQSSIVINLKSKDFTQSQIKEKIKTFHQKTEQIVKELIADKKLTGSMTESEKAKVLYEWMAVNNAYDLTFSAESYTGYGAAINGKAVCQGYTAMYNLMCKLVGIEVEGLMGKAGELAEGHMWTIAILDGKKVHIDTTFGDPVPDKPGYCNFDFFARDSEFMKKTHTWDTALFGE